MFKSCGKLGFVNVTEYEIPNDFYGTVDTIKQMQKLVSEGKRDPFLLNVVIPRVIRNAEYKDKFDEVDKIFNFIKLHVRYVYDPFRVELIQSPIRTLQRHAADCDDLCVLLNTLCEIIGLRTFFKTIKADPSRPDEFSHVYSIVVIKNEKVPADCSVEESYLGWEPSMNFGEQFWPGSLE